MTQLSYPRAQLANTHKLHKLWEMHLKMHEAAGGEWHPSDQACTSLGFSTISTRQTHPSSAGNESDIQEGPHDPIQAPESTATEIGI